MYRSKIFHKDETSGIIPGIDLSELLDKKRISVNSDDFKIHVDSMINI
jgi:hypothetical protein